MMRFDLLQCLAYKLLTLGLLTVALFTASCSQVRPISTAPAAPVPENVALPEAFQKQVQSSIQWQVIANDLAEQLMHTIQEKKLAQRPIFIYSQTKRTPFTQAFNDFLITTLVNKGVKVSNQKLGSHIFNYKIQLIEYRSIRGTMVDDKFKFTSLGAGFVVVRNVGKLLNIDGLALATGATLDAIDMNTAPNMEIIITSSLLDGQVFISRTTDIYYANSSDKHLYTPPAAQRKASDVFNEPFYQMR